MTTTEFPIWLKHHISRFTGCGAWLSKFPIRERHALDVTSTDVRDAWERIIRDVDLADANAATDALADGTEEFSDRGYDCHPRDVRRVATGNRNDQRPNRRRTMTSGEETFRCLRCKDFGQVLIYDPRTVDDVRNNEAVATIYTACAYCGCGAGHRRKDQIPFDGNRHCVCTVMGKIERQKELTDWLDGQQMGTPFHADAWSGA